jgi:hypothetical protein
MRYTIATTAAPSSGQLVSFTNAVAARRQHVVLDPIEDVLGMKRQQERHRPAQEGTVGKNLARRDKTDDDQRRGQEQIQRP